MRLLEKEFSGAAATASGNAVSPAAVRGDILIVDDDETLVRLLVHLIGQEGLSARAFGEYLSLGEVPDAVAGVR